MKKLLLLVLLACGGSMLYDNNDLELLTAYRAKELCSCLFVMEMDEQYCADYTVAAPNLATYQIDRNGKAVTTEALLMWGARAHMEKNERFGCVLDK